MGTDNLFHKRKAKNARRLQRQAAKRDPYDKVLIVCEGEKTEPCYFRGLRNHYGLNTANVEVCGDCDSDPLAIVRYAKQRYQEEKDTGDAYDKVFCVFDKDQHTNYPSALNAIASSRPGSCFVAINSVPCFEYWLLLHFDYRTRPYAALPGNSAANQVITALRQFWPEYEKRAENVFAYLLDQLEFAKNNATRAWREAQASGADNPSTRVHELVTFLQGIKG